MTQEDESKEAFLDRWSRRKLARTEEKPSPPQQVEAKAGEVKAPAQPLPPVETLTPDSDFKPFMAANVDGATRRAALKRLFADAQFNVIDPFEPYSIDLTGEDPIPDAMMKTLHHVKRHLFEDEQKAVRDRIQAEAEAQAQAQAQGTPQTQAHETDLKDVAGKQDA
jgi:hypothetical protein